MYKIIAIMGKAGAGKDTLMQEILKQYPGQFNEIVSCTTRPPREGEVDGINYYFLTEHDFQQKIAFHQMLEFTEFREWYYGTSKHGLSLEKINIGVFNPAGVAQLIENEDVELGLIWVIADDKIRVIRQLNREERPDVHEIIRRFSTDEEDFKRTKDFLTPSLWVIVDNSGEHPLEDLAKNAIQNLLPYMDKIQ